MPNVKKTVQERIDQYVKINKETGCWLWTGYVKPTGYGVSDHFGKNGMPCNLAHRMVYEYLRGAIPPKMTIDHLCRVRRCVNPEHLDVVTLSENSRRAAAARRARKAEQAAKPKHANSAKTHCKRGHELAGDNLIIYSTAKTTMRWCRICKIARHKAYKKKRKALEFAKVFGQDAAMDCTLSHF